MKCKGYWQTRWTWQLQINWYRLKWPQRTCLLASCQTVCRMQRTWMGTYEEKIKGGNKYVLKIKMKILIQGRGGPPTKAFFFFVFPSIKKIDELNWIEDAKTLVLSLLISLSLYLLSFLSLHSLLFHIIKFAFYYNMLQLFYVHTSLSHIYYDQFVLLICGYFMVIDLFSMGFRWYSYRNSFILIKLPVSFR